MLYRLAKRFALNRITLWTNANRATIYPGDGSMRWLSIDEDGHPAAVLRRIRCFASELELIFFTNTQQCSDLHNELAHCRNVTEVYVSGVFPSTDPQCFRSLRRLKTLGVMEVPPFSHADIVLFTRYLRSAYVLNDLLTVHYVTKVPSHRLMDFATSQAFGRLISVVDSIPIQSHLRLVAWYLWNAFTCRDVLYPADYLNQ